MMGALDCVNNKMTGTESTEVIAVNMSSNSTINEPRRDLEAQSSSPNKCLEPRSLRWTLGLDLPLLLIILALIALFEVGIIPNNKAGFYCNDPALSLPDFGETVTTPILVSTLLLLPIVMTLTTELIFGCGDYDLQARTLRSIRQSVCVYRTYLYGLLMNLCIIEVMKGIVGNPRPVFFELCQPDTAKTCNGSEYVGTFTCTSSYSWWYQMDSYRSFPSGHTSMSVYCGFFLAWYLQNRAFNWSHRSVVLVPVLQMLCISYAIVCSLTRITDHRHHWWDVTVGAAVGLLTLFYAVVFLADNFYEKPKSPTEAKPDDGQKTVNTLIFDERQS